MINKIGVPAFSLQTLNLQKKSMKTKDLTCIIVFFAATVLVFFTTASCTKEKTIIEQATEDTLVDINLLTSGQWKMESVYGMLDNSILGYTRGVQSNTQSFDNEYYIFNKDFTGHEIDNSGYTHHIPNWELIQSPNRTTLKMTYYNTPNGSIRMTIIWDYITLKNGMLHFEEYYFNPQLYASFRGKVVRSRKN